MLRAILVMFLVAFSVPAQALTFKSGGTISSGQSGAAVTDEAIDACRAPYNSAAPAQTMQAMSFNIRYDNQGDGSNSWQYRDEKVASIFSAHNVSLGGLQEVLHNQMIWLQENLTDYEFVGVGRDDGKQAGEYAPIFFRKDEFELLNTDTIWLSETPQEAGSKGWDAALPRIATFALLRHKASQSSLLLGSAHYDHRGGRAKLNSGKVIHDYISAQKDKHDIPLIILTGDFNDKPNSATTKAIETKNCLFDARRLTDNREGPNSTWNGFRSIAAYERIDYVFVNPAIPVTKHVIDDRRIDGGYPSDHLPVIVSLGVPK